jgi:GTP cyclohydrolase FolE2
LVVRVLSEPQFTEDVSRDVAKRVILDLWDKLDKNWRIYIESILNDSIHIHDVRTVIDSTLQYIMDQYNA